MALLEVKKTPDGKVLVRRTDRKPLSPEDRELARRLVNEKPPESAPDDPVLPVDAWFPVFSAYVHQVIDQSQKFDLGWVRENRQELYRALKNKEAEIDALQEAQLSTVMALVQQWRDLILRGEFEQRKAEKESA